MLGLSSMQCNYASILTSSGTSTRVVTSASTVVCGECREKFVAYMSTMRSSSSLTVIFLLVPLALAACASILVAGAPSQLRDAAATTIERPQGGRNAPAPIEGDAFYHKVGKFAVWVYSMWHEIKPVPELEKVLSASTRPAEGGAVDYVLVLRVARLGTCQALVWGVPSEGSQDWKLKYFKPAVGA